MFCDVFPRNRPEVGVLPLPLNPDYVPMSFSQMLLEDLPACLAHGMFIARLWFGDNTPGLFIDDAPPNNKSPVLDSPHLA